MGNKGSKNNNRALDPRFQSRAKEGILESDNELHCAALTGNLAQVQSLIHNFDINAKGAYGRTALWRAASEGHTEVVYLLLTLNADVNIPNVSTRTLRLYTPLQISFLLRHPPSIFHQQCIFILRVVVPYSRVTGLL